VDILYQQLQKKREDSVMLKNDILVFENKMKKERLKTDEIQKQMHDFLEPPMKRKKIGDAKEACGVITTTATDRFTYNGHLEAASLLCNKSFKHFSESFLKKFSHE
jgi:hypothetical protein